jgi:hypothetical protein
VQFEIPRHRHLPVLLIRADPDQDIVPRKISQWTRVSGKNNYYIWVFELLHLILGKYLKSLIKSVIKKKGVKNAFVTP